MTTGRLPSIEGGIQPTIVDAKGDLITATAADTPARIAVGSNGQLLAANSATATGLEWQTVSSGGMTLLSTTTLSGTSTTVSSISGSYTDLYIVMNNVFANSGSFAFNIRPNGGNSVNWNAGIAGSSVGNDERILSPIVPIASNANNSMAMIIHQYSNTTAGKPFQFYGTTNGAATSSFSYGGTIGTTSAITSMTFTQQNGTPTWSGTVLIYGVR